MALTPSIMLDLGTKLPPFRLLDTVTGRFVAASDFAGTPLVVAVICNHCPFVKHIEAGISELGRYCRDRGVAMVAVSANDPASHPADGPQAMADNARRLGYVFPYLFDEEQSFVRELRAVCTPEFYLFDRAHELAYRGQLDSARPNNDRPNDGADLKVAVDRVAEGKKPSQDQKPSIGCSIKWKPGSSPEYLG